MKVLTPIAAFAAVALVPISVAAPWSTDYQRLIREATENYRGDFVEGPISVEHYYFYGSFTRDTRDKYLRAFTAFPCTRSLLDALTSNQTMQLTPSRTEFTFHHD